eukprot:g48899.t1
MSGLDYHSLGEPAVAGRLEPRHTAGLVGALLIALAGFASSHLRASSVRRLGEDGGSSRPGLFVPSKGLHEVIVQPGPLGPLQMLSTDILPSITALFVYTDTLELTEGLVREEGWLYGARLHKRSPWGSGLAICTGNPEDVLKGTLLSWAGKAQRAQRKIVDGIQTFLKTFPEQDSLRRAVTWVVRSDGSCVQAYWYYQAAHVRDVRVNPSALRNAATIKELLAQYWPPNPATRVKKSADNKRPVVLEVAAGTGQHAAALCSALPQLDWLATDADQANLPSMRGYLLAGPQGYGQAMSAAQAERSWGVSSNRTAIHHPFSNWLEPFVLDVAKWENNVRLRKVLGQGNLHGMLAVNLAHVSPFQATQQLLALAAYALRPGGYLLLYGPFNQDGKYTSEGNARFDKQLRETNADWGLRDVSELAATAAQSALALVANHSMPANNLVLAFQKPPLNDNANDRQASVDEKLGVLREEYAKYGQQQVFMPWEQGWLSEAQKAALLRNLGKVDLASLSAQISSAFDHSHSSLASPTHSRTTPFLEVWEKQSNSSQSQQWFRLGLAQIASSKVAAILMAGGQGTRLGSFDPKGCYDVLLPSHKSIFQLLAEKLISVKRLAAQQENRQIADVRLPWYIMTSDATHDATVSFFMDHDFFGFPKQDVLFFQQESTPCVNEEGRIFLSSLTTLAASPNGNGGLFRALHVGGMLDDMRERGVQHTHVFGVDNVLAKPADPTFIGFCVAQQAQVGNKVVFKEDPHEAVGVMALVDGRPAVVEYSDITPEQAEARCADGKLLFRAANIAQHFMSVAFLTLASQAVLPFHLAQKRIPFLNDKGKLEVPAANNGIKMEMFVFDSFALVQKVACLAVRRDEEFSAVKNAPGSAVDSPDTARRDISRFWARLVMAAGGTVHGDPDRDVLEVNPIVSYEGENLTPLVNAKTFTLPFHIT